MAINFPSSPTTGQSYTDTTTGQTWIYNGTGWSSSYNRSSVVRQSYTASAGQTTFTVSGGYAPGLLDVYQNGVKLVSGADYTATNGTTFVLTAAATAGDSIEAWGLATFTVSNSATLAQVYARAGDAGPVAMRNRIINGDMRIDQRRAGAALTPVANTDYIVDRFALAATQANRFFGGQNYNSVSPPTGFTNYAGVQCSSSQALPATDFFGLYHRVEGFNVADLGWGTSSAQSVTLTFCVYCSLTGTFGGSLQNSSGTRSYPFSYSIPTANAWTTISIVIPGDIAGTWLTNNGIGIQVFWGLGVGSTYSGTAGAWSASSLLSTTGAVSVVNTQFANFYLTGVQLEVGGTATPFERRFYGEELLLCQRYYEKSYDANTAVGTATAVGAVYSYVSPANTARPYEFVNRFKVQKRTSAPTLRLWSPATGSGSPTVRNDSTATDISASSSGVVGDFGYAVVFTSQTANQQLSWQYSADAEL